MRKRKNELLEKAEHLIEEPEQTEVPRQEPERTPSQTSRNNALLRYISVLFCAVFLLVALSFLRQLRNSQETISQLNQNASSALSKAEQLQDENRALTGKNQELNGQISQLEQDKLALQRELEEAGAVLDREEQRCEDLENQLAEEKNRLKTRLEAYELLAQAQRALSQERTDDFADAMEKLAEMLPSLDQEGALLYADLFKQLQNPEQAP
ncbi:MAG: hypothetical protein ACI3V3_03715 [Faecousia sp.]